MYEIFYRDKKSKVDVMLKSGESFYRVSAEILVFFIEFILCLLLEFFVSSSSTFFERSFILKFNTDKCFS